ncbi:SusC/RagA family TonB-linked outer membrane protein [Yeosuana marina]|uniref:SusC/RagA family TonB-linked outer membrane protein n=1 Tax=Yeosuana marina TaxID=1565536 RepID=UPI0030C7F3AB
MKNTFVNKVRGLLICVLFIASTLLASHAWGNPLPNNLSLNSIQQQIKGKVVDVNGVPIAGVSIQIKNTNKGSVSDFDGSYSILAQPTDVLVFSALGYEIQEIVISNQTTINVSLKEDVTTLDAVTINAGYYSVSEKERTGNISRITTKDIELQPIVSPLQALQGRMPGIEVSQLNGMPGANPVIRIRGRNSLRDDGNLPLYVVDGVPINAAEVDAFGLYAISGIDPLSNLNSANIESIEVLKDADATSIYGSRGANGVVLISTKKGRAGKTRLNLNSYSGVGTISKTLDMLHTEDYLEMRQEAFSNENKTPTASNAPDLLLWDQNRYTDWQEKLLGNTAFISDVQASLSGGSENTSFLFGLGHHTESLVFPGDFGYKKFTGNLNLNHTSSDNRFRLSVSSSYGIDTNNNFNANQFIENAITLAPNAPALYNKDGSLNWENSTWSNPAADLLKIQKIRTENLVINAVVQYELFSRFWAKLNMGYTTYHSDALAKDPISSKNPEFEQENNAQRDTGKRESYILEPQLNYSVSFGKSELEALAGVTFQKSNSNRLLISGQGFVDESMMENFAAAERQSFLLQDDREYAYNAAFGRLAYHWNHTYFLNLTGRRDGSSRFGPGRKFGNFGALGTAWIFSNTEFVQQGFPFLSFGKLRGSYGTTGNDQISDYGYYDTYQPTNGTGGLYPTQLANPDYSWEVNKKLELAGEFGFFKDRLMVSASWYRNRSSNQLVGYSLPALTGFTSIQANLPATVENRGWELQLTGSNIQGKDFNWNTSLNITFPENELLEFENIEESSYANRYRVGHSLNSILLYHNLGVDTETGIYVMDDVNGDDRFDYEDRTVIQDMGRQYYGGLNNSIRYKGFSLDFFFQFVKQKGRNYLSLFSTPGRDVHNQPNLVMDRWQEVGDASDIQKFSVSSAAYNAYNRAAISDASLTDASFIRLRTISLSYQMPSTFLGHSGLDSIRLYLHGQNLLTITGYDGLDPESASYGSLRNLPPLRMITGGIQLTF